MLFYKVKTAYDMRISYWSSDVCSSDLSAKRFPHEVDDVGRSLGDRDAVLLKGLHLLLGGTFASRDDRTGMTHATSRGRGLTRDETDDGDRKSTRLNSSH